MNLTHQLSLVTTIISSGSQSRPRAMVATSGAEYDKDKDFNHDIQDNQ
jgi:hypothetical protein